VNEGKGEHRAGRILTKWKDNGGALPCKHTRTRRAVLVVIFLRMLLAGLPVSHRPQYIQSLSTLYQLVENNDVMIYRDRELEPAERLNEILVISDELDMIMHCRRSRFVGCGGGTERRSPLVL
jgi:hypothetical protein